MFLAWLYWDPPKEAFTIPFIDTVIVWYGVIFALGFIAGYFLLLPLLKQRINEARQIYPRDVANWPLFIEQAKSLSPKEMGNLPKEQEAHFKKSLLETLNAFLPLPNREALARMFPGAIAETQGIVKAFAEKLTWFIVIGTIVGARLGHVIFYDWPYYSAHPIEILMIRKGGLASHGGTLGVIIGLVLFLRWNRKHFPEFSLISLIDILVIPTAVTVSFIRIGNFFNQEILGNETLMPWGVIFGHAADGTAPIPRHPVQLYEASAYLATFAVLYAMWKIRRNQLRPGLLSGIFFILVFGSRFFIEFLKTPQTSWANDSFLQMGQYLSIPFVCLGIALIAMPYRSGNNRPAAQKEPRRRAF